MGQSQSRPPKETGRTLSVPNPNLDSSILPAQIIPEPKRQNNNEGDPEGYNISQKQLEALQIEMRNNIDAECKKRMLEGLAKGVEETERKFLKYTGPRSPFANELQQQVHQCYHENLRQPLNCSKVVREFTETVERERRNAAFSRQS